MQESNSIIEFSLFPVPTDMLEDLQAAVGGYIECVYAHDDQTLIVGNDEAKLLGMERGK